MVPEDLRKRVIDAADHLDRGTGVWSKNIAGRLRRVASDISDNTGAVIRRSISLADYNHLQSKVNALAAQADGWSTASESYAAEVVKDLQDELADTRRHQATIIELIQFGWIQDQ